MFDYLSKFNDLSSDLKSVVTDSQTLKAIEELEKEFNVDLASLIIKIMVKEIDIKKLPLIISVEFNLNQDQAKDLANKIIKKILYRVADYLNLPKSNPTVDEIISVLKLKFKSDESKNIFSSVLDKYVAGVKDRHAVREILTDKDGLGLTDKVVDGIFAGVESIKKKHHSEVKNNLKVENEVLRKIEKLSHGQIATKTEPKLLEEKEPVFELAPVKEEFKLENIPVINPEPENNILPPENLTALLDNLKNISIKNPEEKPLAVPEIKKEEKPMVKPIVDLPVDNNGKIKMSDIKKIKVTGPIDELKFMDLVNFHRLAVDPEEIFTKIKLKLEILENMDYGKMLEGIKAWRQSPINKLYLKMFFKASDEGKSIIEIIEELKQANQEYLTYEEIQALIKFNRSLVF